VIVCPLSVSVKTVVESCEKDQRSAREVGPSPFKEGETNSGRVNDNKGGGTGHGRDEGGDGDGIVGGEGWAA
jgi:hypothetical protein